MRRERGYSKEEIKKKLVSLFIDPLCFMRIHLYQAQLLDMLSLAVPSQPQ